MHLGISSHFLPWLPGAIGVYSVFGAVLGYKKNKVGLIKINDTEYQYIQQCIYIGCNFIRWCMYAYICNLYKIIAHVATCMTRKYNVPPEQLFLYMLQLVQHLSWN